MPAKSACHTVRAPELVVLTYYRCFYYFNPQLSLLSNTGQPEQGTSPKEDGLKNDDIDVCFSQLKLDDKGQYKNVLCHCQKTNHKV